MSEKKPYYLTTAIAYTSGKPHIGNVYEIVLADSIARYKRMLGYDVRFQTGTDEHGQKVEERAKENNEDPKQYVDKISGIIKQQFDIMNVSYDHFIRTTDEYHERQVQKIFRKLYDQGDIYKGEYEGQYCQECEAFYTPSQIKEEGICPVCGSKLVTTNEETYFFRMSKYAPQLMKYIDEHPDFIQPESRKNEMVNNFLKPGLQDLSVTRTSFKWGIPVDFDPKHVIYVWIDALSNYITGLGYDVDGDSDPMFQKYWPADLHLIGKDILRFHTIYWPIILMALGLPLPKHIFGHPWLLTGSEKMSKSKGNVIYADDLVNMFGVDAVRFLMLHEMPFSHDGHLTYDLMIEKVNTELANNLGNCVNRVINMQNKYFNGMVANPNDEEPVDEPFKQTVMNTIKLVDEDMDTLHIQDALNHILELFSACNKYIDDTTPWVLAKDPNKIGRLATVLYNLLESIRIGAILLRPFMPDTSDSILEQLQTSQTSYESISSFGQLETNIQVTDHPVILFARINPDDIYKQVAVIEQEQKATLEKKKLAEEKKKIGIATIDDFHKLDIRSGKVLTCDRHPNADKLYVLKVNIGEDKPRTIVSGLADAYTPGQVMGRNVVVICNLKPADIRGVHSEGMLLAGKDGKDITLIEGNGLKPGTKIY